MLAFGRCTDVAPNIAVSIGSPGAGWQGRAPPHAVSLPYPRLSTNRSPTPMKTTPKSTSTANGHSSSFQP